MTAYANFTYGGINFPLGSSDADTGLLALADPTLLKIGEFSKSVINTYLGTVLQDEAAKSAYSGSTRVTSNVGQLFFGEPSDFVKLEQYKWPLLALFRKKSKLDKRTTNWRQKTTTIGVHYILPPMTSGQAGRLAHILNAVEGLLDDKYAQGFDPSYNSSELVWTANGITSVVVDGADYGSAAFGDAHSGVFFHAWMAEVICVERVMPNTTGLNAYSQSITGITDESVSPGSPVTMVDLELDQT